MNCAEIRPLLGAYFDSELDLTAAVHVEQHVSECPSCARDLQLIERLQQELAPALAHRVAPGELRALGQTIRRAAGTGPSSRGWAQPVLWAATAAALAMALLVPLRTNRASEERELVDSHVRSLMASHLVDVPSSSQHTVRPWFQGKVDFAPAVPDLAGKGYELVGGRLDVLQRSPAAALVYKHGAHFLNLWTSKATKDAPVEYSVVDGYLVARWAEAGLKHSLVTDMNRGEVENFVALYRAR